MSKASQNSGKNILGYSLQRRLGSGAYGEVWSAVAPGGISKAVKLVYGYHDERRAQNELKSLNRIKEVRHPFLLSLERIEVVNGQLVVISELADMSLKERYDACRETGESGIPRHELLGYMRDAADALDFISESYSLQHLDVKPENLLLMGGHIKVADFGLVKDVHEATLSMMAGLTPAYASPEMFDGRPGKLSDQYSLAIVYQEMLTGVRPFSGTTAAQLAAQHLKGRPQVDMLPRGDQGVMLRALSKNPELRFRNCRELVEELANPKKRSTPQRRRRLNPALHSDDNTSPVHRVASQNDGTMLLSESSARLIPKPAALQKLPPVSIPEGAAVFRPTLIIGVGNTGAEILRKLNRRLDGWLGQSGAVPSIRLLAIDTDPKTLSEVTREEIDGHLSYGQVVAIPLRRPEEYRNDASMHLNWLSRRWIYNVPRSLLTEGIRPLGRLGFVDHCEEVLERIQKELKTMTQAKSLEQSASELGFASVDAKPRVIVVGSIAGGTASGIMADLGYALRTLLSELELTDDGLLALMISSAHRASQQLDLSVGNVLACLTELNHYFHAGYPGDETCGLPAYEAGIASYTHTYVVQFADSTESIDYETSTDNLAEYLYMNTASHCSRFFDIARASNEPSEFNLRSLGISHTGLGGDQWSNVPARLLSHHVVTHWLEHREPLPHELTPEGFVVAQADKLGLDMDALYRFINKHLHDGLRTPAGTALFDCARKFCELNTRSDSHGYSVEQFCSAIDTFDSTSNQSDTAGIADELKLSQYTTKPIRAWLQESGTCLHSAAINAVNHPASHLQAARQAVGAFGKAVRSLTEQSKANEQQSKEARGELRTALRQAEAAAVKKPSLRTDLDAHLRAYADQRIEEYVWGVVASMLRGLESEVSSINEELTSARRELDAMVRQLTVPASILEALRPDALDMTTAIINSVVQHIPEHVAIVERNLREGFLQDSQQLHGLLTSHAYMISDFLKALLKSSKRAMSARLKEIQIDRAIRDSGLAAGEIAAWIEGQVKLASPVLNMCGGTSRLLLGLPEHSTVTALGAFLEKQYKHCPTVAAGTRGDVILCFEVDRIPVENIAYTLLESHPQCCDLVPRLLSRIDVNWSRLTELG